ncbi:hypothetical protein TWF694_004385 [Orbilia ellipsospora]|uniref:Uncharacterized protein n=1 Tax=Orbilia ellipsospora TaxID=2528407 RepID=A0AAV9WWJ2_9PEZI
MSAKGQAELGAAAAGSVYAVTQLIEGLHSQQHGASNKANEHYLKAAAGAVVAIGAYEMLKAEKESQTSNSRASETANRSKGFGVKRRHSNKHSTPSRKSRGLEAGHTRRVLEETAGAYSLGRELMGDRKHRKAHLAAEALGAIGLLKEVRRHRH